MSDVPKCLVCGEIAPHDNHTDDHDFMGGTLEIRERATAFMKTIGAWPDARILVHQDLHFTGNDRYRSLEDLAAAFAIHEMGRKFRSDPERITALLPKIQECAKPKTKYGREEIFARIEWDLPKLRQVLKEGL